MSESSSSSKSHDSFNHAVIPRFVHMLFEDNFSRVNQANYNSLYGCISEWIDKRKPQFTKETDIQLDFYQNCMKVYNLEIDETVKYTSNYTGSVFKNLFGKLIPDFCIVDYYNAHAKSKTSGLDLEFLPFHIVSILEIKKNLKDSDIGQLLHYLRIVLDYSPTSRTYIIGAITDFKEIRYGKVSRTNNSYEYTYQASVVLDKDNNKYLLEYLAKFFTMDSSNFGYKRLELLPGNILIHNKLLGIGANAMVFNCLIDNDKDNEYTLKISNTSVDKEVSIYKTLYKNKLNIDKVHEYVFLFHHPPGRKISVENLFNNLHILYEQIKEAHKNNILHRDIRISNIIEIWNHTTRNHNLFLIDWHSSVEGGTIEEYCGSLTTASKFILNELANKNRIIEYLPIDDWIEFMKMILLEIVDKNCKKQVSIALQQGNYEGIMALYELLELNYAEKPLITLKVIKFLEKHRSTLNSEMLNNYIDQCMKKRDCLCRLENQQTDIEYFDQLEKCLFFP